MGIDSKFHKLAYCLFIPAFTWLAAIDWLIRETHSMPLLVFTIFGLVALLGYVCGTGMSGRALICIGVTSILATLGFRLGAAARLNFGVSVFVGFAILASGFPSVVSRVGRAKIEP